MSKKYDLAAIVAREGKKAPLLTVDIGDGKTLKIPQRVLWPDAAIVAARNEDVVTFARELAGEEYDAFLAAGGTAVLLWQLVDEVLGMSSPESTASTDS